MISVKTEPVASLGLPQMHFLLPAFVLQNNLHNYMFVCVLNKQTGGWKNDGVFFKMIFHSLFGYKLTTWPATSLLLAYLKGFTESPEAINPFL